MADDFGFFSSSESGAPEAAEEDPAAAFLAQQESEIAGIENDEGFGAPAGGQAALAQPGPANGVGSEDMGTTINGDVFQEANGSADGYAAIAQADRLTQEPESIRKWREEQRKRLQELGEGRAEAGWLFGHGEGWGNFKVYTPPTPPPVWELCKEGHWGTKGEAAGAAVSLASLLESCHSFSCCGCRCCLQGDRTRVAGEGQEGSGGVEPAPE